MMHIRRCFTLGSFSAAAAASLLVATGASSLAAQERVVASAATGRAPEPSRDSAIAQLTNFLARYPDSPLRANALYQLGELLVRRADAEFDAAQRAAGGDTTRAAAEAPIRPAYEPAIARYEELVRRYPDFPHTAAAAYTLGTLYYRVQRYAEAARMFDVVTQRDTARLRSEAFFRLGDAYFEVAARQRGAERQATFARASRAYEQAVSTSPKGGDIYFLSLYKLGWSYYNQATRASQEEYQKAVDVFGRLVAEYDQLSPDQQAKLGLRGESIEYMAIAFTQVGGAEAAERFFAQRGDGSVKRTVLRRVAESLRDQGNFAGAVDAYRAVINEAPTDSTALASQREVIDIYQNRVLDPERAQQARLELVERFAPGSPWAQANPGRADSANRLREEALRQSGQYALAQAQRRNDRALYAQAAELYGRYTREFTQTDSGQVVAFLYGEALFGQGEYARAGQEYERAAYQYRGRADSLAQLAGQNAIVAYDSALVRNRTDRAALDTLFAAVDRYVAAFPQTDVAKRALVAKGRAASVAERWDVMASTFRTYVERYPSDPYTPTAQKLIGDALFKQGQYAEAQQQWEVAQRVAASSGRRALADTITRLQRAAVSSIADTLIKQGEYRRAAEEVYVAFVEKNASDPKAPEALRNAIETYMLADSAARARNDDAGSRQARERAAELSARLVSQYPRYQYRLQYQNLQGRLLAELGRREESVEVLRGVIRDTPRGAAQADAMLRLATTLDSLGRKRDAAAAYEQFASAYAADRRAAGAQYNAAVTYREAGDTTAAVRAFGAFASRFPRDTLATPARAARLDLLRASGDTATVRAELTRACARPTEEIRADCAAMAGERAFRQGVALFPQYQAIKLVIPTVGQLTAAGVQRASARKRAALRTMTDHFTRAIRTGSPEWLSAATYYIGLGQWEYGNFLTNVQLPASLTEEQRSLAEQGAAQQAAENYEAARKTWQSLLDKAEQEKFSNPWVDRAREALTGNVPAAPPTSRRDADPVLIVGGVR